MKESFDSRIRTAARLLSGAEYVLIGGGAGLSAAAGLTYSGKRFTDNFGDFIARYGMSDMYTAGFYPFKTPEEKWAYWSRHILVNRFEPPARSKGQVARAALYMADSYGKYRLSRQQEQLFNAWNKMYPVDEWECIRAKRIEKLQGNENRFVKEPCEKAGLW